MNPANTFKEQKLGTRKKPVKGTTIPFKILFTSIYTYIYKIYTCNDTYSLFVF